MSVIARFLRAVGLFICVTGLGVVLLLTTSRFYSPPATSVQAAPANQAPVLPEHPMSTAADVDGTGPTRHPISNLVGNRPHTPAITIPIPDKGPTQAITSPNSLLTSKKTSPASPLEKQNAITRLVIPDLRLDTPVKFVPFEGNTWHLDDLGQSVAWLENMAGDTIVRNVVLAGHVTVFDGSHGPFRYLSRLTPGSHLTVYSERYIYTYRVRELTVVNPEDAHITENTKQSQLTLLTCATWNEKTKTYLRRQVVIADLVKVELYPQGIME